MCGFLATCGCLAAATAAAQQPYCADVLLKTLDPFYKQHIVADGMVITGSDKVSMHALREVEYLARKVLANRPDVRKKLGETSKMYVCVMAYNEMQTDLPECRGMQLWWSYRARGLAGRPVSCGEENVLGFPGDPWQGENIFIHEFAHGFQDIIAGIDAPFGARFAALYDAARKSGRIRGYAMDGGPAEFWAEGVQAWFNCNGTIRPQSGGGQSSFEILGPQGEHVCHLATREQLKTHLPEYARLLDETFRQNEWVYVPVAKRLDEPHLRGYDPAKAPTFRWPPAVLAAGIREQAGMVKVRKEHDAAKDATANQPQAGPLFHRAPLLPGAFAMMPLGSVKPRGWLRQQLLIQSVSLVGRLDEFYPLLNDSAWLGGNGEGYQWGPYYADGIVPLAYLLDDPALIKKARKWLDWSLDHPRGDGWIGPPAEKLYRPWGLWYPTPMLKAYVQFHEATGDPRVLPVLTNFFKCLQRRMQEPASGAVELAAGEHDIMVTYFDFVGPHGLKVYYEGPGIKRRLIPDDALASLQYEAFEGKWKKTTGPGLLEPDATTEPWKKMPDLNALPVAGKGKAANFDISLAGRENNFALRFTGKIKIPKDGSYRFFLVSDDGSKLHINGKEVVNHDGIHPMIEGGLYPEWAAQRWGDHAYVAAWLYDRTGADFLVDVIGQLKKHGRDWSKDLTELPYRNKSKGWSHTTHGVNIAMGIKAPGMAYLLTGDAYDRDAVKQGLANLDQYHGTPVGVFTADECLAGRNPVQGTELCAVIDEMFSLEVLLSILGDSALADRLELITYNAWPATLDATNWTHQYDQQVNQVVCSRCQRPWTTNGPDSSIFGLDPNFPCCTTNLPQGWPKFAANVWMASPDKGLAAVVYAPSEVTTVVADGRSVKVTEQTDYPFDGTIRFTVTTKEPVEFPLYVRIPAWAGQARVTTPDGQTSPKAGRYHQVKRLWKNGDVLTVDLQMQPRVEKCDGGYVVRRGPLVYALRIGEDWRKTGKPWPAFKNQPPEAADFEVHPTTPWNYALSLDLDNPENSITFEKRPGGNYIFDSRQPPVLLKVRGRRVPEWQLDEFQNTGPLPPSPVHSAEKLQEITLIPYGAAKLRVTVFPLLKE